MISFPPFPRDSNPGYIPIQNYRRARCRTLDSVTALLDSTDKTRTCDLCLRTGGAWVGCVPHPAWMETAHARDRPLWFSRRRTSTIAASGWSGRRFLSVELCPRCAPPEGHGPPSTGWG